MSPPEPRDRTESPPRVGEPLIALLYLGLLVAVTVMPVWYGVRARGGGDDDEVQWDEL